MGAEVSQTYKLGITLLLLSWLIVATGLVIQTSIKLQDNFIDKIDYAFTSADSIGLRSIGQVDSVGAPTAYRTIEENISRIKSLSIKYLNGTITSDYKTLLKHANATVKVIINERGTTYDIKITEVERKE